MPQMYPTNPNHNTNVQNEWKSETNYVPTTSAIWQVKTDDTEVNV